MEEVGLISFQKKDDNKKNIYVFLTEKGRSLKKKLVPLAEEVNKVAIEDISEKDLMVTRKVLLKMLVNLSR